MPFGRPSVDDAAVQHPLSVSMHFLNRSDWPGRRASIVLLLGALPMVLHAQVRRPETPATDRRASRKALEHRTEILLGGGIIGLDATNTTKSSMFALSVAYRGQLSPDWLHVGGAFDIGRTTVDGKYFPYEKRAVGDSVQFVQVDGHATMLSPRVTGDALFPLDEDGRYRAGVGASAGFYVMLPSPSGGAGAGSFIAPTVGASFLGEAELTDRFNVTASLGLMEFLGFDREKLRPSDPALEDPVFTTPFVTPPPGRRNFGGVRLMVGLSYRLGVKPAPKKVR